MDTASPPHLSFVKLIVRDLERSARFYIEAFDMREINRIETRAMQEVMLSGAGAFTLVLYRRKEDRPLSPGTMHGPIGFITDDVDRLYAKVLHCGGQSIRPPADHGTMRAAFVAGPEGHEIELLHLSN